MIRIRLLDELKVDAALALRLGFVRIIGERASLSVEDEPPAMAEFKGGADLGQVAAASGRVDGNIGARFQRMTGRLHVDAQVEIRVGVAAAAHRQITRQGARLRGKIRSGGGGTGR